MRNQLSPLPKQAMGIIYAGGTGSRLWPVSTKKMPKQINVTFSKDTLVVETYKRALKIFPKDKIILVVTKIIYLKVKNLIDLPENNFLVQPDNADTAAAMGLVAMYLETKFPGSIAVTFYSDHDIPNDKLYINTIKKAIKIVIATDHFLTIGTKPSYPSTDFGYIKLGKKMDEPSLYKAHNFIEKPSKKHAIELSKSEEYVWNTGVYIWPVGKLLKIVKAVNPKLYDGLISLRIEISGDNYEKKLQEWYQKVKRESFDKAISEKTKELYVLVSNYNWKDIGNWKTIYDLVEKDKNNHAIMYNKGNRIISIDSSGCLIIPRTKIISLVGVKNLIVVETKGKLLICNKDHAAKVKDVAKIVNQELNE